MQRDSLRRFFNGGHPGKRHKCQALASYLRGCPRCQRAETPENCLIREEGGEGS